MAQMRAGGNGARRVPKWVSAAVGAVAVAVLAWLVVGVALPGEVTVERAGGASPGEVAGEVSQGVDEDASASGSADNHKAQAENEGEPEAVTVHVDGAVASPGVYSLELEDPRVADAVEAAGGLGEGADTTLLNLAARVEDAMKVYVPKEGEEAAVAASPEGAAVPGDAPVAEATVNLNTATAEELCSLPGVGEATAAAILEDRSANGPFTSIEDVMRVSGIGEKKFAKMKDQLRV
ncbi:ComEA family DNA-binding protein [Atopobiaceae bacterium 24-176]